MMYLCVHTCLYTTLRVYTDVQSAFLLLYISLTLLYVCLFGQCLTLGVNLKVQFALRLPRYATLVWCVCARPWCKLDFHPRQVLNCS